ncbi:MAG: hypothetical protein E7633_07450 [Ruminococcaceae bacterium]|nr:hypothetical protein [Oscillospiraceae bacterium]
MKTKTHLTAGAVISAAIGVTIGYIIKNLPENLDLADIISAIFVLTGIFTLLSSIPDFVYAIICFGTFRGAVDLISAIIGVISGFILIFLHDEIMTYVIMAYLIIFPIARILAGATKEEKRARFKRLSPKIFTGIILLAVLPAIAGFADTVFDIVLKCVGWGIIVISLIFLIVSLLVIHFHPKFSEKQNDRSTIYLDEDDFSEKK